MQKQRNINTANNIKISAHYSLLMALILQLGITSILCATSSYTANANAITICSALGLKTITLDENGEPVEQEQHQAFSKTCFHCASGCGLMAAAPQPNAKTIFATNQKFLVLANAFLKSNFHAQGPPPRAPPVSV